MDFHSTALMYSSRVSSDKEKPFWLFLFWWFLGSLAPDDKELEGKQSKIKCNNIDSNNPLQKRREQM